MSVTALRIKSLSANLSAAGFEVVIGTKIRLGQAALTAVATLTAAPTRFRTVNAQASLTGFAATVSVIDIIHIDAKLTWMIVAENRLSSIQAEDREYSIIEELRSYSLVAENREYTVTRELLTSNLQGP